MYLPHDYEPALPRQYKMMMAKLSQGAFGLIGNAHELAKVAVNNASRSDCMVVSEFLDRFFNKLPGLDEIYGLWVTTPVDIPPTLNGSNAQTERFLRAFFAEMRQLLAKRLNELEGRK